MQVMMSHTNCSSAARSSVAVARREAYGTRQTVQPAGLPVCSAWRVKRCSAGAECKRSAALQALAINGSDAEGSYADIERRLAASEAELQVYNISCKAKSPVFQ